MEVVFQTGLCIDYSVVLPFKSV